MRIAIYSDHFVDYILTAVFWFCCHGYGRRPHTSMGAANENRPRQLLFVAQDALCARPCQQTNCRCHASWSIFMFIVPPSPVQMSSGAASLRAAAGGQVHPAAKRFALPKTTPQLFLRYFYCIIVGMKFQEGWNILSQKCAVFSADGPFCAMNGHFCLGFRLYSVVFPSV